MVCNPVVRQAGLISETGFYSQFMTVKLTRAPSQNNEQWSSG
jgi:hypothetical protein